MEHDHYRQDPALTRRQGAKAPTELRVAKVWLVHTLPRLLAVAALVWLVLLVHSTWPEQAEFSATAEVVKGPVQVYVPGTWAPEADDVWTSVWAGRELYAKDRLRVGSAGDALLSFSEGTRVRVLPDTSVDLAELAFDRGSGSRSRRLNLQSGSLFVRTGKPVGSQAKFEVAAGPRVVSGFGATYWFNGAVCAVYAGQVTAAGKPVAAGQACDLGVGKVRPQSDEEKSHAQQATAVPTPEWNEACSVLLHNLELGFVMRTGSWLLAAVGHEPGTGNPFARFSVVNSTRRGQALKRMADLVTCMTSGAAPPASVRLDDLKALGLDEERISLCRQAFYRGQLLYYKVGQNGQGWQIAALANDRQHTKVVADANGAKVADTP